MFQTTLERERKVIHVEWLRDEIISPRTNGKDRGFQGSICRHDHHRNIFPIGYNLPAKINAARTLQIDVGYNNAKIFLRKTMHGFFRIRLCDDVEAATT